MVDQGYVVKRTYQQHPLWKDHRPALAHLDLELTERCNNACIHCYINLPEMDAQAKTRELSTARWQTILDQAAALGVLSVRFTGGEPLLRDDFTEIYLHARRLGLKVTLFTNGRLITPQLAALFTRVPPLEKIEITVYGMSPKTYDAIACAPGAYESFRRGVDLLLENNVPLILKGVLLPQFQEEMEAFETWAATIPWMEEAPSYSLFLDLRGRRDSLPKNKLINQLRVNPDEALEIITRDRDQYRREMTQFCTRFMGPGGDTLFTCGAGLGGCIDAYGFYQPCMLLRAPEWAYDLSKGSLQDALENFFPQMRKLKTGNPIYLERCARCFLHGLCEQCPARSWMEHGDLDTPVEYLCQIAHARAQDLGLLSEGELAWQVENWQERIREMEARNS